MGKKSKRRSRGFEWVRDDVEGEAIELVERRNRSEQKRRLRELEALAQDLAALTRGTRRRLPLDPEILSAVEDLAESAPTPDRRRKLLRLKTMLSEVDEADLDAVRKMIG